MSSRSYHRWSGAEKEYLRSNFEDYTCEELASKIGVSIGSLKKMARELKLVKSAEALSKIYQRPNPGQFKSVLPKTENLITTRKSNNRTYKWIRVEGKWIQLHRYNWLQSGREIPAQHNLIFKNGDTMNCEIENLSLAKKGEKKVKLRPARRVTEQKPVDPKPVAEKTLEPRGSGSSKAGGRPRKTEAEKAAAVQARRDARIKKQADARESKENVKETLKKHRAQIASAEKERQRIQQENALEEANKIKVKNNDTSKRIPLRIDSRTTVYIRPGQDPKKVLEKYLHR